MYLIKRLIFSLFILLLASCSVTFKGQVKDDPFLEKLPSMVVNFGSICKAGLKDYVVEDFNKNVVEKGDGSNGNIIIYLCKTPDVKVSHSIIDFTIWVPLLPIVHFFGVPFYKVNEEICLNVLILNSRNGIIKTYKKTAVASFWVGRKSEKSEEQLLIETLESIKSDIKTDLPQIKKDLLASR